VLDGVEAAALAVAVVGVDTGADDQLTLVRDMTTVSSTGFSGSDTNACSGWLSTGRRNPAIAASTLALPATTTPTFGARIVPRVVSTPVTPPLSRIIPVTSHCSMMSTLRASAARANPHATASWRATPARRCSDAPSIG
jgi:hypothetical protein